MSSAAEQIHQSSHRPEVSRWVAPDVGEAGVSQEPTSEHSIARLREQARAAGYAAGLQAGEQEGRAQVEARLQTLDKLIAHLAEPLAKLEPEALEAMLALSVRVSEALLGRELAVDKSLVLTAISTALETISDTNKTLRILVNPGDLQIVQDTYSEMEVSLNTLIAADPSVASGGAVVESGSTIVDAQLSARLDEVLGNLLDSAPDRDG